MPVNEETLAAFARVYRAKLEEAVTQYPDEYPWANGGMDVAEVAERMIAAVRRNSFNKDSRAIKAACKELGIKPFTYTAIYAYLAQAPGGAR